MEKKIGITTYLKPAEHKLFKENCKNNDVTMAAKLLEMAKAYNKKEAK